MPGRWPRGCRSYPCREHAVPGYAFCVEHQRRFWARENWSDDVVDKKKFYNSPRWKQLRQWVLTTEPVCRECRLEPARVVDHIRPLGLGGAPYALDNLQPLCFLCNRRKSQRDSMDSRTGKYARGLAWK